MGSIWVEVDNGYSLEKVPVKQEDPFRGKFPMSKHYTRYQFLQW